MKTALNHVLPVNTQINLHIEQTDKNFNFHFPDSPGFKDYIYEKEDSDQTALMRRLI